MTKPITIDEMLETLRKLDLLWASTMNLGSADRETGRRVQAIRAILEQHRQAQERRQPTRPSPSDDPHYPDSEG